MGEPLKHTPVKLIIGLISNQTFQFNLARRFLEKKFGKIDKETDFLDFSCTNYYQQELGENLKRKFFSFKKLLTLKRDYNIKLYTNALEKKFSKGNRRTINIDPGYISLAKLVLFTTKNRSHRIYIDCGIYADLELWFVNKTFEPLEWTYPDYKTKEYIDFFNSVRDIYKTHIRGYL
ncbi:MAG: DUF4416 family protein [Candidatus Omnitrophica bacterium]|nr:DUF4416 family protein [Candidatus Omnitrophota bacterium]